MKPQCTTQAECHRKYADWLDARDGSDIDPRAGWKLAGKVMLEEPTFYLDPSLYEIAIGVLDGKIVWRDSVLYWKDGRSVDLTPNGWNYIKTRVSWNKPRQTITINGKEVAKPKEVTGCSADRAIWTIVDHATEEDAQQFRDALNDNMLRK